VAHLIAVMPPHAPLDHDDRWISDAISLRILDKYTRKKTNKNLVMDDGVRHVVRHNSSNSESEGIEP
jgi:hypothetical protein